MRCNVCYDGRKEEEMMNKNAVLSFGVVLLQFNGEIY
jgi:hypothetical protein